MTEDGDPKNQIVPNVTNDISILNNTMVRIVIPTNTKLSKDYYIDMQ
uniref:Uncharacterized protein n=1 Tax=viral metagenome TaxID=1070528 RepID=A0A6C0DAR5_9ZZZZ